jgi:NADH-quinone oxidoreductase subunit M
MIVTAIVVVPLLAAFVCAMPVVSRAARPLSVAAGLAVAAIGAAALLGAPDLGAPDLRTSWAPGVGAGYVVAVDPLSAAFLMLLGVVFATGAAASAGVGHRRAYFTLWDLLLALLAGLFIARDLLLFFIFWEACLVPVGILLWAWGGTGRRSATLTLVTRDLLGSASLLVGIVSIAVARGTLDLDAIAARPIPAGVQLLPAILCLGAFASRLPLFPLHGWLPRVYVAATTPLAIVVAGGLATSAAYGIVRVCLAIFPQGMSAAAPVLVALAAVGVLYGALVASRQDDLRRLLAFMSLAQLNLIALALFAATATSLRGAVLATISHGLVIGAALLVAAMIARRTSSFALSRAGGLASSAPALAALFTLTTFAAIGLPGTSGFSGTVVALAGAYERFPAATAVAALVFAVAAVAGLGAVRRAFHGPPLASGAELRWRERLLVVPLLALVVALGVAPRALTDRIGDETLPSVDLGR